ncbi:MAG: HEAT repeat domain-containing protein [Candidatus Woesearchaeota archaeon]
MENPLRECKEGKCEYDSIIFEKKKQPIEYIYEDIYVPARRRCKIPEYYSGKQWVNQDRLLWIPDQWATGKLKQKKLDEIGHPGFRRMLKQCKSLLLADYLPTMLVLENVYAGKYYLGVVDWGKEWLVKQMGVHKIREALPELREIVLHAEDEFLRYSAITAIHDIGGRAAAATLCEVIRDQKQQPLLREDAAESLYDMPYPSSVKTLRDAIEDTREITSKGERITGHCLRALGKIPTTESLDAITKEIDRNTRYLPKRMEDIQNHLKTGIMQVPYSQIAVTLDQYNRSKRVEHWARLGLEDWIKASARLIFEHSAEPWAEKRKQLLRKLILKYGTEVEKQIDDWFRR